jgi:voltage-gated potassium channel
MKHQKLPSSSARWRQDLHTIVFEADTAAGKAFDIIVLTNIILSVVVVLLGSTTSIHQKYGNTFLALEWFFTLLFTVEYILRLISVRRMMGYVFSFYGLVDLLSILPTYLSIFIPGGQYLIVIRLLRLLRIFRILKLAEFLSEANELWKAMVSSRRKISVFLLAVVILVFIIGSLMYVIEGEANGFTSIPTSIYWAIVTLTTVGYGDLAPKTALGKMLASLVMLLGYGILAVPTGIVTAELTRGSKMKISTQACPHCGREGHDYDARHCKYCGKLLNE